MPTVYIPKPTVKLGSENDQGNNDKNRNSRQTNVAIPRPTIYIPKEIEEEEKVLAETVVSLLKDTEKLNYYRASAAKRIAFFNSSQIDRQWIDLINSI